MACTFMNFQDFLELKIPYEDHYRLINRNSGIDFNDQDLLQQMKWMEKGHHVFNNPHLTAILRDKEKQFEFFKALGLPTIPTLKLSSWEDLSFFFKKNKVLIIKTVRGNQGKGQYRIDNKTDLERLFKTFEEKKDFRYLVQPFFEGATETRFVVLNNQIRWVVQKKEKTTFNKIHETDFTEGLAQDTIIPREYIKTILKSHDCFFAAFDFLYFDNQWFILEGNNIPGIIQLEKATGENIAKQILQNIS